MKCFKYDELHMIVKCPICGKEVINDNIEKREVNGVKACKHLLFVYIDNPAVDTHFYYVKSGMVKDPDHTTLTDQDIKVLDSDPNRIVHRYTCYDNEWTFLFQQVAPKAGDIQKIIYERDIPKVECPVCGKKVGGINEKIRPCKHLMVFYGGHLRTRRDPNGYYHTYLGTNNHFEHRTVKKYKEDNSYAPNKGWKTTLFNTVMQKKKCIGIQYVASSGWNYRFIDTYVFTIK